MENAECLKTYVAPLLQSDSQTPIQTANGEDIYWLDRMLNGGFVCPNDLGRPLIVLIAGPPGVGKSLLTQQICYNRALHMVQKCQKWMDSICGEVTVTQAAAWLSEHNNEIEKARSLYVTLETSSKSIYHNMATLGLTDIVAGPRPNAIGTLALHQSKAVNAQDGYGDTDSLGLRPLMSIIEHAPPKEAKDVTKLVDESIEKMNMGDARPWVVVIDSLNVIPGCRDQGELYQAALMPELERFTNPENSRPAYIFLVLDVPHEDNAILDNRYASWAYHADVILQLDRNYGAKGYLMKQIEIVKARFQGHVQGKQLFKVFGGEDAGVSSGAQRQLFPGAAVGDPEGSRPNLARGGVFVYPSVHYVLSVIRAREPLVKTDAQQTPSDTGDAPLGLQWPVKHLKDVVGTLVPLNSCTALVGRRGLHKSYLAYQFLLDAFEQEEDSRVMVISFRDNAEGVNATLEHLCGAERYKSLQWGQVRDSNRIQVIYQRPGFVTADELMHRIVEAVGEFAPTRVMVNSLDQWGAGYPLLASTPNLVPAMIDFLNTQGVTSMIIGVDPPWGSVTHYGLAAKAEVVLSFSYQVLPWPNTPDYRPGSGEAVDGFPNSVQLMSAPTTEQMVKQPNLAKVIIRAVRVPQGAAGLNRGVLEYLKTSNGQDQHAGLQVIPLAPEYPMGEPVII